MRISIIIRAFHNNTIRSTLKYLSMQSIHENLEIIIIDECNDDISDTIDLFKDKFENIIIKSSKDIELFNKILLEAKGEYILFTTSNDLSAEKSYVDEYFLENLYMKTSQESCDMNIFNKLDYHEYMKLPHDYEFIDSIIEKPFKYDDISKEELITLPTLDCDVLYSNDFKVNPSRFSERCPTAENFRIENLVNANNILISDNYSTHRKYFKTLKFRKNDFKEKEDVTLNKNYEDSFKLDIKKVDDIKQIVNQDFKSEISIITPVYNPLPNDIIKELNSIFYQDFGFNNLEMIFIDDASTFTDGVELVKKFSDIYPNIHFFDMEEHLGSGSSFNIGLDNATGEYIMLSNQNTYLISDACEILYDTINREDADIVSGNFIDIRMHDDLHDWNRYGFIDYQTTLDSLEAKRIALNFPTSVWSKIYKKSFLDDNNIHMTDFDVEAETVFDYETLLKDSKLVHLNDDITVFEEKLNSLNTNLGEYYNFQNLLEAYHTRYYLYDLCEDVDPEITFTVLNSMNFVTNDILFKTTLNFDEFKQVVDYSEKLYSEYLENPDVKKEYDVEQIATCIESKDYDGAIKIYNTLKKKPTNYYYM